MNSLLIHSEPERLWQACLERLAQEVTRTHFAAWLAPLRMGEWDDDTLTLLAPNTVARDFVYLNHRPLLEKTLSHELGAHVRVAIALNPNADAEPAWAATSGTTTSGPRTALSRLVSPKLELAAESVRREAARLVPRMTFESFVEGDCNRFALAVARQVAEHPGGPRANPLLLIGGTGLGKTHIMNAVGNFALSRETARKIVYRTSEEFAREYLEIAVQKHDLKAFHRIYQNADVLLLDDIQFFGGEVDKPRFRSEMVYVLSTLQAARKQIILTCDRRPEDVQYFDRQILRQIESGLVADLGAPDHGTRLAILQRKAVEGGWNITPDVLELLAEQFTGNVRQLEGALLKLCAFSDMCGGRVDRTTAEAVFRDVLRNRQNQASPGAIAQTVAESFGIDLALMRSRTRKRPVAVARQLAMLLIHELTDNTLHSIGVHFGRDYSTVTHSLEAARALISRDAEVAVKYRAALSRFRP